MKHILYFIITFLLCITSLNGQEYFEGEIHFVSTYQPLSEKYKSINFAQIFGEKSIALIGEDQYLIKAKTAGAWQIRIYNLKDTLIYTDYERSDSIIVERLDSEPGKLLKFEVLTEIKNVMDEPCKGIYMSYEADELDMPFNKVNAYYFYSDTYPLNKTLYNIHTASHWNKYMDQAGAVSLYNEIEYAPVVKSITTAEKVIERKIDPKEFEIDKSKRLVYRF